MRRNVTFAYHYNGKLVRHTAALTDEEIAEVEDILDKPDSKQFNNV